MIALQFVAYALGSILITLLSILLSPVIVLFSDHDGNLPAWLRYFQTFDATHWAGFYAAPVSAAEVYLNRLKWIVRNPAYGFDFFVFGKQWVESDWLVKKWETTPERDLFFGVSSNAFNFYYQGPAGTYKFGWKAWNHFDAASGTFSRPFGQESGNFVPLCCTINPFKHKQD